MVTIDSGGGIGLERPRLVVRAEEARLVRSRTVEQEPVVLEGRLADATLNRIVTIAHGRSPRSVAGTLGFCRVGSKRNRLPLRQTLVAEWRGDRAGVPLRHRVEGRPHTRPGGAGAPDGVPGRRHGQPATALLRGRGGAGAGRCL